MALGLHLSSQGQGLCGTDYLPDNFNTWNQEDLNGGGENSEQVGEIYTIPLVFHIIHVGEPEGVGNNIHDSIIYEALAYLNEEFNDSSSNGANIGIKFKLAKIHENGCRTNGIDRVDGRVFSNYKQYGLNYDGGNGVYSTNLASSFGWDRSKYYNVYIVNRINNPNVAGFAYYPTTGYYDGTYISKTYLNGGILAHEIGHALGLYHTFEGDNGGSVCPPNQYCTSEGDRICDTPPHVRSNCNSGNSCDPFQDFTPSRNNFMSYCHAHRGLFTEGQKSRMRNALQAYNRNSLIHSKVASLDFSFLSQINPSFCRNDSFGSIVISKHCASDSLSVFWPEFNKYGHRLDSLSTGIYQAKISDNQGHVLDTSFEIQPLHFVDLYFEVNNPNCPGDSSGLIHTFTAGLKEPLELFANNQQIPKIYDGIPQGSYVIYAIDGNGCNSLEYELTLIDPDPLVASIETSEVCNECDATAEVQISGGNGAYQLSIQDSMVGTTLKDLCAQEYTLQITDQLKCTSDQSFQIDQTLKPELLIGISDSMYFQDDPVVLNPNLKGGIFQGEALEFDSVFNPSLAVEGWNMIEYYYSTAECDFVYIDSVYVRQLHSIHPSAIELLLKPNPASLKIEVMNISGVWNYKLIDALGSMVQKGQIDAYENQISLAAIHSGYYILVFSQNDLFEQRSLIVRPH